jgi:hypothetical protein
MISTEDMLVEHLPYRMQQVDGLCWATRLIAANPSVAEAGVVFDGRWAVRWSHYRVLTNALAEAGLLYCRVLMGFLGIAIDRKTMNLRQIEKPGVGDEFSIVKLSLPLVSIDQLASAPTGEHTAVLEACQRTLIAANKGVAHFTDQTASCSFIADAHLCGETVLWLIEHQVYRPLKRPAPGYKVWTNSPATA